MKGDKTGKNMQMSINLQMCRPKLRIDLNKIKIDNPAAALVTQVPQGATKPVVNPT